MPSISVKQSKNPVSNIVYVPRLIELNDAIKEVSIEDIAVCAVATESYSM